MLMIYIAFTFHVEKALMIEEKKSTPDYKPVLICQVKEKVVQLGGKLPTLWHWLLVHMCQQPVNSLLLSLY